MIKHRCLLVLILSMSLLLSACSQTGQIPEGIDPETVAAVYHENVVTKDRIEYERKVRSYYAMDAGSDADLIEEIVGGDILLEEAERLGVAATEEETQSFIQDQLKTYEDFPEAKAFIDEYCAAMEITFEDYRADLEQTAYGTVSRQKLRDELGRRYCQEHGLEFTKVNPPWDMAAYVDDYLEQLIAEKLEDVVYYIQVSS